MSLFCILPPWMQKCSCSDRAVCLLLVDEFFWHSVACYTIDNHSTAGVGVAYAPRSPYLFIESCRYSIFSVLLSLCSIPCGRLPGSLKMPRSRIFSLYPCLPHKCLYFLVSRRQTSILCAYGSRYTLFLFQRSSIARPPVGYSLSNFMPPRFIRARL
jgi:hypothetical protein